MTDSDRSREFQKKIEALEREVQRLEKVRSELTESEEKYRLLVENANDAIFIVQDGQVQFPNRKAREIGRQLGLDLERVPFIEYVHPEDRDMVIDRHQRRLRGEDLPHSYTFRLTGGNGCHLWVVLNAVLIDWNARPATLNFLRDITAQKGMEAQLDQIQKLEALAMLAGGVAHDFKNLLMSIRADATAIGLGAGTTGRQREMLEGILASVSSGEAMIRQLQSFARRDSCEFVPTDMNQLLRHTLAMFDRTRHGLSIRTHLEENLWEVDADPAQMERVILNLLVNARQAMACGGKLILTSCSETIGRDRARRLGLSPGPYVKISVADNGPGMDEATLKRVFEPFFTTKEKGQGTGLGLACSFGIVQSHYGVLTAASQQGSGARFDIYLPVSGSDQDARREKDRSDQAETVH